MKTKKNRMILMLTALLFALSACSNAFEDLAKKDTDEALYEDALRLLDRGRYRESVSRFERIGPGFASRTPVRQNWAGALAGQCGLNFVAYLNSLGEGLSGTPTFFQFLVSAWDGVRIEPMACMASERKIKEIWSVDSKTSSQQLFMSLVSLSKMGTVVRETSDNNENGGTGDGIVDPEFNACDDSNPDDPDQINDTYVAEVATGLALFLENIAGFEDRLSPDVDGLKQILELGCSAMTPNPCTETDAANVTPAMVRSMRRVLDSAFIGVGTCVQMDVNNCCPGLPP